MRSKEVTFAEQLLVDLSKLDPLAKALILESSPRARRVALGIYDGEFVRLLGLGSPSASVNVMSLFVWHHNNWAPTFERGTPALLAQKLAGPLRFTWSIAVTAMGASSVQ
jgi:hypothetical protein